MDLASPGTGPDAGVRATGPTRIDVLVVAAIVAVSIVLRFVTRSPLWLDEALSTNIAVLPIGDIFEALRQDGHPPLYYVLLHGWMAIVGEGDAAVRSLSGTFAVATLPLAWIAGRRRAGTAGGAAALLVVAIAPYSLRYATEARMYAMASFLGLAAWLVADDLRRAPDRRRWLVLAALTGALLLTHYWAIYVGLAAVSLLAWRWWRLGARSEARRVGSALAAGAVLFLPWLPSFLYQATHTGTPWGTATRPTRAAVELAGGLGGGETFAEGILFGFAVIALALLGLSLVEVRGTRVTLDLTSAAPVRAEMALVVLTLVIGLAAGAVSGATFIARYGAVTMPLLLIAAGIGLARLPSPWIRRGTALALVALSSVGALFNVIDQRTQGEQVAAIVNERSVDGDLVVFCPDQLGPSTLRALDPGIEALAVPTLERPDRIDWVDYADRNRSASVDDVAAAILERAAGRTIWLVDATTYRTYEELCPGIRALLGAARTSNEVLLLPDADVFEPATLSRFDP